MHDQQLRWAESSLGCYKKAMNYYPIQGKTYPAVNGAVFDAYKHAVHIKFVKFFILQTVFVTNSPK